MPVMAPAPLSSCSILAGPEWSSRRQEIAAALAPRLDYRLVAELCNGIIEEWLPPPSGLTGPRLARVVKSLVGNTAQARHLLRSSASQELIYSTGETWGVPVGLVGACQRQRRFGHVVYVHRIYSTAWLRFLRATRDWLAVDGWICITQHQAGLLRQALAADCPPVTVVSQGVDTTFYDPGIASPTTKRPYVLAVGTEMRDYPLFFEAVRDLQTDVLVKASSSWMAAGRDALPVVPDNTTISTVRITFTELRDLYAGAGVVVVPLFDTPQAAGITTILEAMAMRRCVIATRSAGLPDILVHGVTGIISEPDSTSLSTAIQDAMAHPGWARQIADNGYETVRTVASLEAHADGVVRFLDYVSADRKRACATHPRA